MVASTAPAGRSSRGLRPLRCRFTARFPDAAGEETRTFRAALDVASLEDPEKILRFLERKLGVRWEEPAPQRPVERRARAYSPETRYDVGDRVEHPKFGLGTVTSAAERKVTIRFDDGERTLKMGA